MSESWRVVAALLLAVGASCRDSIPPELGAVRVIVETTGEDIDTDGYTVSVDGRVSTPIPETNGVIVGVPVGARRVQLGGHEPNCSRQPSERLVTIVAGDTVDASFSVRCRLRIGVILVTVAGEGLQFDVDGFTIGLDDNAARKTGVTSSVRLDSVAVGQHRITLSGLARNCTGMQAARDILVQFEVLASVEFQVFCEPVHGVVRVRARTTGEDHDPDGYTLSFQDEQPDLSIGANIETTVEKLVGNYSMRIYDVFPNCAVAGENPRSITVREGQVTDVTIDVACSAMGTMRLLVTTTGVDLDPNGYQLRVSGTATTYDSPTGTSAILEVPRLLAAEYTVTLTQQTANCDVAGSNPRTVVLTGGATTEVAFDVSCSAARHLAFTKIIDGNADIHLLLANGIGESRLTSRPSVDAEPSWSPDGQRIVFRSDRDGNAELYVMSATGADQTRLTTTAGGEFLPRWSPTGDRIAYTSHGVDAEIYVMNPDGTNVVNLTKFTGVDEHAAWSPDGNRIAFRSDRNGQSDIWVMNSDGSNVIRLTNDGDWEGQPAWSPDGSRIAFTRLFCGNPCVHNIVVMNADGTGAVRLESTQDESEPAWSPDGKRIAFMSRACDYYYYYYCGDGQLAAMKPDGTSRSVVATGELYNPVWRP
jgi:TolB protein